MCSALKIDLKGLVPSIKAALFKEYVCALQIKWGKVVVHYTFSIIYKY